jgi:hypothetical protein
VLLEAGKKIGPGHSSHGEIAAAGGGRYSVWSDCWLYFSTTDNSDPNTNGRTYTLDFETAIPRQSASPAASPAVQEMLNAVSSLTPEFRPRQAFQAVKRGLDILYPGRILNFNSAVLDQEFTDLDLVAERYLAYQAELSNADAVFLSIYCAGRTWIRFFLKRYVEAAGQDEISLAPRTMQRTAISPSLCFTHDFLDLYETIAEEPWIVFEQLLWERPLVLLTRDLRDLAVSSFFYLRSSQPRVFARLVPSGSFAEYIDSPIVGIERLARLLELQKAFFEGHPGPKLHLSYERLHAEPSTHFRRLLELLLFVPVIERSLEEAVHMASFEQMQALEIEISRSGKAKEWERLGVENWSGDLNDLKVRSGKVGRFREFMPSLCDLREVSSRYPATAKALVHWEGKTIGHRR